MNNRERALAILNYENYDRMPVFYFTFWKETIWKWVQEGHLTEAEAEDVNHGCSVIGKKLGFDCMWPDLYLPDFPSYNSGLYPPFEERVLEVMPDGTRKVLDGDGVVILKKEGSQGIPAEIDHTLKDRESWEEHYLPRLQFTEDRFMKTTVGMKEIPFGGGGLEYLQKGVWEDPFGLNIGSLYGVLRNWMGLTGISYLQADDPDLLDEMIDTVANLCYDGVKWLLDKGCRFDMCHFWEDICFNSGPLVNPTFFRNRVGPHYRRITELLSRHGIRNIEVDSDGIIDTLIPAWLENGVNIMFPVEAGSAYANIKPWREKYGRQVRGVGGMAKRVFAYDYAAIDAEIERLKPLVDLGGYIPSPDHGIPPDAKWENVQYYCEKMRKTFQH